MTKYYKERKMTANLSNLKKQYSNAERTQVSKYIESYIIGYKKALMAANSDSVVVAFHKEIDGLIEKTLNSAGKKVTCAKGCSFCCSRQVMISEDEGKLLLAYCKDNNISIDWAHLNKQEGFNPGSWLPRLPYKDKKCVFLNENGECNVYEHRPAGCRTHMVSTPKEKCDLQQPDNNDIGYTIADFAEVVASAMFNCSPTGPMADILIKLNKGNNGNFLKTV